MIDLIIVGIKERKNGTMSGGVSPPSNNFGSFFCFGKPVDGLNSSNARKFFTPSPLWWYIVENRKKVISLDSKTIGSRMKKKRVDLGLTQVDVSMKCNISSRYYGSIESGRNSPSIEKLKAISEVLGCSLHFLLNDRMDDMESRVKIEKQRLEVLFEKIPSDKLNLVEGLITQAARLRILLDDNWKDIIENGEYEKFKQSENQLAFDRKRPIVENYDNRDKTYQSIIKQLTELLPSGKNGNKRNKLLGRE